MASKRRQRRKACEKKKKYDKQTAYAVALKMRHAKPGQRIDAYLCPLCKQWHVGHRPYRVQQAISARRRMEQ